MINLKDNEACEEAIRKQDELDIQIKQLQQEYHGRFLMMLPANKVLSIIKAEEKFHRQIFKKMKSFNSLTIDIKEDKKGNIWFATQGNGLWCYRRNKTWKQYLNDAKDTTSVCSNQINCVQEDSKGRLLVATNMGLCEYQPSSDSFHRIAIDAGLDPEIAEMYREFVVTEAKKRHQRIADAGGDPGVLDVFA